MLSEKMQNIQNLIDELVSGYIESKYDEKYLKEKITDILEFILPKIAAIVKGKKERELVKLWDAAKEDEKIKNLFRGLFVKIDRPIIIYVASKFENNQYFGTRIIEEALRWK